MKTTAKDLRFRSKEIISAVERGEEVIITYRGIPKAKIIPYTDKSKQKKAAKNRLFGIWNDHEGTSDVREIIKSVREKRQP